MQFTEFMFRTFYELQISFVKKYTFCKHMIYLTKAFFFLLCMHCEGKAWSNVQQMQRRKNWIWSQT